MMKKKTDCSFSGVGEGVWVVRVRVGRGGETRAGPGSAVDAGVTIILCMVCCPCWPVLISPPSSTPAKVNLESGVRQGCSKAV